MISPAECLFQYLIVAPIPDQGNTLATDPAQNNDWPCFVSLMPDQPDNAICVYDTSGILANRDLRTGFIVEYYGIGIRLRAAQYVDGYTKLRDICRSLDALTEFYAVDPWSDPAPFTHEMTNASRKSGIFALGSEQSGSRQRRLWTVNYTLTIVSSLSGPIIPV